jgi:hypothetical protein
LTYDSGVLYDANFLPQPIRKKMAKVKLNLASLTDEQLLQKANDIKTAMTGNANFTSPVPTLAALGTLITTAQSAKSDFDSAQQTALLKTTAKNNALDALRAGLTQLASFVDAASAGDDAKIQSAGMGVRAAKTPAAVPDPVSNLSLTAGDNAGELDLHWDPAQGAKSYEVHISPDPVTNTSWNSKPSVTKSKTTVADMASGTRVWTRVRAINSAGQGAWSSPISKVVP